MVTKEEIIEVNKKILAVSGTQYDVFGMMNSNNLEYAVDLAKEENRVPEQAAVFMQEIIRGQPFTNGNKRTAFETAKGVMESGGYVVRATEKEIIDFTKSVQTENKSKDDIVNWIEEKSEFTGTKKIFRIVTMNNVEKDKELLKKMD
ncbi:MAG: type II toxin-antitoxin system death-on-curing family toxin [Nanoarchaeota archaeon]